MAVAPTFAVPPPALLPAADCAALLAFAASASAAANDLAISRSVTLLMCVTSEADSETPPTESCNEGVMSRMWLAVVAAWAAKGKGRGKGNGTGGVPPIGPIGPMPTPPPMTGDQGPQDACTGLDICTAVGVRTTSPAVPSDMRVKEAEEATIRASGPAKKERGEVDAAAALVEFDAIDGSAPVADGKTELPAATMCCLGALLAMNLIGFVTKAL